MADFLVRRDDLRVWKVDDGGGAAAPGDGAVRFRVERFGLTSNNVTYGAFGDEMGYWRFFDAPDGWGRIPVWGFGDVVASGVEGITAGDRFYGYFPMSTEVTMRADPDPAGFVESSPERADLPVFYNRYLRALPALGFAPELDDANAIMRPLFGTAWLIADQLENESWYGADTVVLASASSKTAYATAFCLAGHEAGRSVVGLTSAGHREFTEGLGCYDRVLTYGEVAELPVDGGVVLVDMAGTPEVRRAVHERAAEALRASILVGATHWEDATLTAEQLPGAAPEFFFAPARAEQRALELGPAELQRRLGLAWGEFAGRVPELVEIETHRGAEALGRIYDSFIEGSIDPRKGYVCSL